jgi:osmotically-inducible protein OsmY
MKATMQSSTAVDLKDRILDELKWEPSVNEAEVGVIVKEGVVTLTGSVESSIEKVAAELAVQRVSGVKAVANELTIKLPSCRERTDADIAAAAVNAFKWNSSVPGDAVKITADQGWITLRGDVAWHYQRVAAEHAVRPLQGVRGIINDITIKPHVSPCDVKNKIAAALERNALLDAERITVEAEGRRVILRGTVRSMAEKSEAGWAAWSAPGVADVKNEIEVRG